MPTIQCRNITGIHPTHRFGFGGPEILAHPTGLQTDKWIALVYLLASYYANEGLVKRFPRGSSWGGASSNVSQPE